jgi:predicted DCC family thiol-disulfide oxidoreductase YuxK
MRKDFKDLKDKRDANSMTMGQTSLTVYYDGQCGFCVRAMERWRGRDRRGRIDWRDLHASREEMARHDITLDATQRYLHAIDARGRVTRGAGAVFALWSQLPRWRWLALLRFVPGSILVGQPVYRWVERHRGGW